MKCQSESCFNGCEMAWYEKCAMELLHQSLHFCWCYKGFTTKWKRKVLQYNDSWSRDCGKTFLLKRLKIIFRTFANPANAKYAWVDTDQTGVMVLEYFRCSSELILWKDLLLPLEGGYVKLPSPKIQFVMDVWIFSKFSKVWGYLK